MKLKKVMQVYCFSTGNFVSVILRKSYSSGLNRRSPTAEIVSGFDSIDP